MSLVTLYFVLQQLTAYFSRYTGALEKTGRALLILDFAYCNCAICNRSYIAVVLFATDQSALVMLFEMQDTRTAPDPMTIEQTRQKTEDTCHLSYSSILYEN